MDPSLSCCQSFDHSGQWIFRVIPDKPKPMRVAICGWELRWLELRFVRRPTSQEMKWNIRNIGIVKKADSFQYILYACTIACLSIIQLYKLMMSCMGHRIKRILHGRAEKRNFFSTFQHEKRNFVSPSGQVMFYLLYKHQWNTKPFHFNSFLAWKARFIM